MQVAQLLARRVIDSEVEHGADQLLMQASACRYSRT
jgi:hypothetical protein